MILYLMHYRKIVGAVVALLTLISVMGAAQLKFDFYRAVPLPEDDPAVVANKAMGDHFGGQQTVMFLVEAPNVLQGEGLQTVKKLTKEVKQLSGVQSAQDVASLATLQELTNDNDGFSSKPLLEDESNLEERVRKNPFVNRFLISKDNKAALIMASLGERAYPDPSVASAEFLKQHFDEVSVLLEKYSKGDVRVLATGNQLVLYVGQVRTQFEMFALGGIAFLFLLTVFYLSLRSWTATGLATGVIALGMTWTLGTMGWLGIPLSTSSIYLIIILVAVGSSYAIHVLSTIQKRLEKDKSRGVALKNAIYDFSLPLLIVSLTSSLSAISLLTFDIADMREMGVFQALGVTLCYMLSFVLLPLAATIWSPKIRPNIRSKASGGRQASALDKKLSSALRQITSLSLRKVWLSALVVLAFTVLSFMGTRKVIANFVLEETIPNSSMPRVGFNRINEIFGRFRLASVVLNKVSGDKTLLSPEGLVEIGKIESKLKDISGVEVLPNIRTVLTTFSQQLNGSTDALNSQDSLDQMMILIGKKKLRRLIDQEGSRALVNVIIDASDPAKTASTIQSIRNALQSVPAGYAAHIGGGPIVVDSLNHYIVVNKVQSIVMCIIIVFLLCSLVNSSLLLGFICITPAAIAALATFGIMGLFKIDLDFGTSTITTIAIGVGTDFGVHYLLHFRSEFANFTTQLRIGEKIAPRQYAEILLRTTKVFGPVILFDALSNILGFLPLIISSFPILKLSGVLLIANQALVVLLTFFVTPMLILIFKPDFPKSYAEGYTSELTDRLA